MAKSSLIERSLDSGDFKGALELSREFGDHDSIFQALRKMGKYSEAVSHYFENRLRMVNDSPQQIRDLVQELVRKSSNPPWTTLQSVAAVKVLEAVVGGFEGSGHDGIRHANKMRGYEVQIPWSHYSLLVTNPTHQHFGRPVRPNQKDHEHGVYFVTFPDGTEDALHDGGNETSNFPSSTGEPNPIPGGVELFYRFDNTNGLLLDLVGGGPRSLQLRHYQLGGRFPDLQRDYKTLFKEELPQVTLKL